MKNRIFLFIFLILLFEGAYFLFMADMMHLDDVIGNEFSIYKILGKSAQMAKPEDIEKLKNPQLMQLFFAANTPEVDTLRGQFQSKVLDSGLNDKQLKIFFTNPSGESEWVGEEFSPLYNRTLKSCKTYARHNKRGRREITKTCNTDSYIAQSLLDNRKSLHLNFQLMGKGIKKSEHDEIRIINENLFICMIYEPASKRPEHPIPVMLVAQERK